MASESEQENESIESILAEMRREVGDGKDAYCGQRIIRNMDDVSVMQYCDRIEAAWKRERDRLMSEPRSWDECVERAMKVKENSDVLY